MELRDLLELLYTAHNRFDGVQLVRQYWYHVDTMNKLLEKERTLYSAKSMKPLKSENSVSAFQNVPGMKARERLWWQKPFYWRDEYQVEGREATIKIIHQDRFWFYDPVSNTVSTNVADQGGVADAGARESETLLRKELRLQEAINAMPLLDPSFLLASHDLQLMESTLCNGRDAVRVRAVCRKGREPARVFFWSGADEYDLLVDKERGILLRYAAKLRGEDFAIASVESVLFDEQIPESVFSFTPPAEAS